MSKVFWLPCFASALILVGCEDMSDTRSSQLATWTAPPHVKEAPLPRDGKILVKVWSAFATTKSTTGPYTSFLVSQDKPENENGNVIDRGYFKIYVRSDDNVGALERGSIIGMLMSAAQSTSLGESIIVWISYTTTPTGIEVDAASFGGPPKDMIKRPLL